MGTHGVGGWGALLEYARSYIRTTLDYNVRQS